jgi:hypothetical protein|tara:strand:- start:1977 stop:2405 length:429 start_codon:yes stop_codon:yes gene_type:complete
MIKEFQGVNRWLSNFAPVTVMLGPRYYMSVEAAYQAAKTDILELRAPFETLNPGQAKRAGRKLPLRKDWILVKDLIMSNLLEQKFVQDPYRAKLIKTGDQAIEEGNYWHDNYWGNCLCRKCGKSEGENHLGRIIMDIRETLV